jgi:hypothetical protein
MSADRADATRANWLVMVAEGVPTAEGVSALVAPVGVSRWCAHADTINAFIYVVNPESVGRFV